MTEYYPGQRVSVYQEDIKWWYPGEILLCCDMDDKYDVHILASHYIKSIWGDDREGQIVTVPVDQLDKQVRT